MAGPRSAPSTRAMWSMAASVTTPRAVIHEWPRCFERHRTSIGSELWDSKTAAHHRSHSRNMASSSEVSPSGPSAAGDERHRGHPGVGEVVEEEQRHLALLGGRAQGGQVADDQAEGAQPVEGGSMERSVVTPEPGSRSPKPIEK